MSEITDEMVEAQAAKIAGMVTEWVEAGLKFKTDWRNGLSDILAARLKRTFVTAALATVPGESGGKAENAPSDAEIAEVVALLRSWNEPLDHRAADLILTLQQRALQPQPSAPAGGEVAELIEAAQALYDKIIGAGTTVTYVDEERLGKALANLKARSGE